MTSRLTENLVAASRMRPAAGHPRTACPVCGRSTPLTAGGRLFRHRNTNDGGQCTGSGRGPGEIDADLIARLVDHILTDRAHMHCPLRAEVEAATHGLPPGVDR